MAAIERLAAAECRGRRCAACAAGAAAQGAEVDQQVARLHRLAAQSERLRCLGTPDEQALAAPHLDRADELRSSVYPYIYRARRPDCTGRELQRFSERVDAAAAMLASAEDHHPVVIGQRQRELELLTRQHPYDQWRYQRDRRLLNQSVG